MQTRLRLNTEKKKKLKWQQNSFIVGCHMFFYSILSNLKLILGFNKLTKWELNITSANFRGKNYNKNKQNQWKNVCKYCFTGWINWFDQPGPVFQTECLRWQLSINFTYSSLFLLLLLLWFVIIPQHWLIWNGRAGSSSDSQSKLIHFENTEENEQWNESCLIRGDDCID